MLAQLWCLVSPVAVLLLLRDRAWLHQGGGMAAGLRAVRLEQWVAVLLLLAHGWCLGGWWSSSRSESHPGK